jgi:uncharacterized membrane protein YgaE (UPF0421/DUF939 family)
MMDRWDIALLVIVGYLATMTLSRLMLRRRNQMLDEFRREVDEGSRKRAKKAQGRPARPARAA